MRRLLLIVLMLMLPLQSTWAAAASLCAHEADAKAAHFGHHPHQHDGAAPSPAPLADTDLDPEAPAFHADCGVCHGIGTPFLALAGDLPAPWPSAAAFAAYRADVPERTVETLLRPPLTPVA